MIDIGSPKVSRGQLTFILLKGREEMRPFSAVRLAVALALAVTKAGTVGAQQPPATGSPGPATQAPAETPQPAPPAVAQDVTPRADTSSL